MRKKSKAQRWTTVRPAWFKYYVPPAWTGVEYNTDPKAHCVARGYDAAGRHPAIYSAEHHALASDRKFGRVRMLLAEHEDIRTEIEGVINGKDTPRLEWEAANLALLIFETGIRPGSNSDTRAARKAYGATTLQMRHVHESPKGVRLIFDAKCGVKQSFLVTNPHLVKLMLTRKRGAGSPRENLFRCSCSSLNKFISGLGSGSFTAKDFRTAIGVRMAQEELGSRKRWPSTKKGVKKAMNAALDKIARALGNTRAVCKKAYVDPTILGPYLGRLQPTPKTRREGAK
jgi:DNA topoisomerase-1